MIALALILAGAAFVVFAFLVAGAKATDRRMSLRYPSRGGVDAFARKVLGVYVRQPAGRDECKRQIARDGQVRR